MKNTCWEQRQKELTEAVIASVGFVSPFDTTRHLSLRYSGEMVEVWHGKKKLWECRQGCTMWKTNCCK